jgi:hypothetical protein
MARAAWMENIMNKTNDTSHELSEAQLGQVTGGDGPHFDNVVIELGDSPATGGIGAAKDAWNTLLKNYGY